MRVIRRRVPVPVIILMLGLFSTLAPLWGEGQVTVRPEKILVQKRFSLQVRLDLPPEEEVSVEDVSLPKGIEKLGGPFIKPITSGEGRGIQITYFFMARSSGIYTLGPFFFKTKSQKRESIQTPLIVLARDEKHLTYPLWLSWAPLPATLFPGQAVPLILRMENMATVQYPDRITFAPPAQERFSSGDILGEIESRTVRGDRLFSVPVGAWIWMPSRAGRHRIPSAKVTMLGVVRRAPFRSLVVQSLPEAVKESRAIGNFHVTSLFDRDETGVVSLSVRVEGTGNFPLLKMPRFSWEGRDQTEPHQEVTRTVPTKRGWQGYREKHYRLDEIEPHPSTPPRLMEWRWMTPNGVVHIVPEMLPQRVPSTQSDSLRDASSSLALWKRLPTEKEAAGMAKDPFYRRPRSYLLFLIGPLWGGAFWLGRRLSKRRVWLVSLLPIGVLLWQGLQQQAFSDDRIEAAREAAKEGATEHALRLYDEMEKEKGTYPWIQYGRGVLLYQRGARARGILQVHRSLWKVPGHKKVRETLLLLAGDHFTYHQPIRLSPDIFLWGLLFGANGVTLLLFWRSKTVQTVIIEAIFIGIGWIAIVGGAYTHWTLARPLAVIGPEGGILKGVPDPAGSSWKTLVEGSIVVVKGEVKEYYLIEVGNRLEGWVKRTEVIGTQKEEPLVSPMTQAKEGETPQTTSRRSGEDKHPLREETLFHTRWKWRRLAFSVDDTTFGEVVRGEGHADPIAGDNAYIVATHSS